VASGAVLVNATADNGQDSVSFELDTLDKNTIFNIIMVGDKTTASQAITFSAFYTDSTFQIRIESSLDGPTTNPTAPGAAFRLVWGS